MTAYVFLHVYGLTANIPIEKLSSYATHKDFAKLISGEADDAAWGAYDDQGNDGGFYPVASFTMNKYIFNATGLSSLISFPISSICNGSIPEFERFTRSYPCFYDETGETGAIAMFSPRSLRGVKSLPENGSAIYMSCDPSTNCEKAVFARSCFKELEHIYQEKIPGFNGFHREEQPYEMLQALSLGRDTGDVLKTYGRFCCDHANNMRAETSLTPSDPLLAELSDKISRTTACFAIWESQLQGCFTFAPYFHETASLYCERYIDIGERLGVSASLDAYYAGVPIEDVLAKGEF